MKKRFWETKAMFKRRWDAAQAIASLGEKKLWRVDAIQMIPQPKGGYVMGDMDHFTVEAYTKELAIGKFKTMDRMNWFVVAVRLESVID